MPFISEKFIYYHALQGTNHYNNVTADGHPDEERDIGNVRAQLSFQEGMLRLRARLSDFKKHFDSRGDDIPPPETTKG